MAVLADLVLDCAHPATLARFWAAVLDGYAIAPYDEAELDRLRSLGIDTLEDDPTVLVQPVTASAGSPRLWLVRVPEPKRVKNRFHPDLRPGPDGFDAELARLQRAGATLAPVQADAGLLVLLDPEGNEFCLLR